MDIIEITHPVAKVIKRVELSSACTSRFLPIISGKFIIKFI